MPTMVKRTIKPYTLVQVSVIRRNGESHSVFAEVFRSEVERVARGRTHTVVSSKEALHSVCVTVRIWGK